LAIQNESADREGSKLSTIHNQGQRKKLLLEGFLTLLNLATLLPVL
jgi:hypothetical protein